MEQKEHREVPFIQIAREDVKVMLSMDDELLAALVRSLFSYWLDGSGPEPLPAEIIFLYPLMRERIQKSKNKYLDTCRKNQENRRSAEKLKGNNL